LPRVFPRVPACECELTTFTGPTCDQESVSYEFSGRGGIITYTYPRDKQPDTKADKLSLAFITGKRIPDHVL